VKTKLFHESIKVVME